MPAVCRESPGITQFGGKIVANSERWSGPPSGMEGTLPLILSSCPGVDPRITKPRDRRAPIRMVFSCDLN